MSDISLPDVVTGTAASVGSAPLPGVVSQDCISLIYVCVCTEIRFCSVCPDRASVEVLG